MRSPTWSFMSVLGRHRRPTARRFASTAGWYRPSPDSGRSAGLPARQARFGLQMPRLARYIRATFPPESSMPTALRLFIVLLSFFAIAPALAQDRVVPTSPQQLRLSYAPIVQRTTMAVVNVYAAKIVQNTNPFLNDPIFRRFFGLQGNQA